ncbi:vacuolar protein sorting-associated protein 4A-like [Ornithodoros turicata]|uniref:vacuolar protein sorting-associated protein 4A-like n=1 Tax=Ornithodoros turicata TaxID=34597 RepID=UPI003139B947
MSSEKYSATTYQGVLEKANEQATKAEQHDREKKLPEAFRMYKLTLQTYLTVIEEMLFQCIRFQERNEDLLRAITSSDKYRKIPNQPEKKAEPDATDFEPTSNMHRLPGVLALTPDKPVKWTDIIGHETPKFILKLAVLDRCPLKHPIMFTGKRKTLKSMLLFGPSGCGKTYLTKALCGMAKDWVTVDVSVPGMVRDAPEGAEDVYVKSIFKSARLCNWCVLCLQDVHEIFVPSTKPEDEQRYQKIKDGIIGELKYINDTFAAEITLVVATTNNPSALDSIFVNAFQKKIYLPLPRPEERLKLLKQHVGKAQNNLTDEQWFELVDKTSGFCGEDILELVLQTHKDTGELAAADLEGAIDKFKPRNAPEDVQACMKFKEEYANTAP